MRTGQRPALARTATLIILLVAALALAACRPAAPAAETAAESLPAPATAAAATPTPEPAATATPSPTPEPTETPTPTPSATPLPGALLFVPAEWEAAAREALAATGDSTGYAWEVRTDARLVSELGAAQAVLVHDSSGIPVRQEPIALALPFTTNWEQIGRADADAILAAIPANGHNPVQPVLWSQMEPELKALRVDGLHPTDEGYPYQDTWSLVAGPDFAEATAALAPALAQAMAPPPWFKLVAVGDIMLDRWPGVVIAEGALGYPWVNVGPYLGSADYTIANMESSLGDIGEPAPKHFPFQAPPAAAASMAQTGIDLVSLANNHAGDYGMEALLQGIDLLAAQNIAVVGAGANDAAAHAPHIAEINGMTVAFLGYVNVPIEATTHFDTQSWSATAGAPGLAWADPERIRADVAAVRPEVDLVVVILHSGYEYIEEPSEQQAAAAKAAVDAGAALVVGHHAHILQGVQHYQDGVIAYGLGNFVFEIDGPPETAILNVWMDADGPRQLELIPAIIEKGVPRVAESWEAAPILERVYFLTTILNAE